MGIKIGSTNVNKIYLGSTLINKIYMGSQLVFSSLSPILDFDMSNNYEPILDDNGEDYHFCNDTIQGKSMYFYGAQPTITNGSLIFSTSGVWCTNVGELADTINAGEEMSIEWYGNTNYSGCVFFASRNWSWSHGWGVYTDSDDTLGIAITKEDETNWLFDLSSKAYTKGMHHIIATRKPSENKCYLYLDGELFTSVDFTGDTNIGGMGAINEIWQEGSWEGMNGGSMDFLRVYDKALTDSEVKDIYKSSISPVGWTLTFEDTFDGTELDTAKWARIYEDVTYYKYVDENSYLDGDGHLIIKATHDSTDNKAAVGAISTYCNGAGGKVEQTLFSQKYGYFEASIKMPKVAGIWGAFWLVSDTIMKGTSSTTNGEEGNEVDIIEAYGGSTVTDNSYAHTIHYGNYGGEIHSKGTEGTFVTDLYDDSFHKYAVKWTEDYYYFYVDDMLTWKSNFGGTCKIPASPILSISASNNDWCGYYDGSNLPTQMEVDYVRIWSFPEGSETDDGLTSPLDLPSMDIYDDTNVTHTVNGNSITIVSTSTDWDGTEIHGATLTAGKTYTILIDYEHTTLDGTASPYVYVLDGSYNVIKGVGDYNTSDSQGILCMLVTIPSDKTDCFLKFGGGGNAADTITYTIRIKEY